MFDDVKIMIDAIIRARGESLQEVLTQLPIGYIVEYAGTMGSNESLLLAAYSYITERQKVKRPKGQKLKRLTLPRCLKR